MLLDKEHHDIFKKYGVTILHMNCSPDYAENTSLPRNSYLMTCQLDDTVWYDIVMGSRFDIFNAYYDNFGNVITKMSWTKGKVNPKLYTPSTQEKPKKQK